jgi:hypothetical protein
MSTTPPDNTIRLLSIDNVAEHPWPPIVRIVLKAQPVTLATHAKDQTAIDASATDPRTAGGVLDDVAQCGYFVPQ